MRGGGRRILLRYDVMDICPAKNGFVRAKIGLTGQLDQRQPGNYFKRCNYAASLLTWVTSVCDLPCISNNQEGDVTYQTPRMDFTVHDF